MFINERAGVKAAVCWQLNRNAERWDYYCADRMRQWLQLFVSENVGHDEAPLLRCEATSSWKHLFKPECVKSLWWEWIHGQPLHPIYTFTSNNLWLSL